MVDFAIVAATAEGRIVFWDDGATEWFGYTATEAVGRPVDLFVPEELRERHWEGFGRVMAGGDRHLTGATTNLPVRLRDGTVAAFPARFVHLDDPHGRAVGAMAIFAARRGDEEHWTAVLPR